MKTGAMEETQGQQDRGRGGGGGGVSLCRPCGRSARRPSQAVSYRWTLDAGYQHDLTAGVLNSSVGDRNVLQVLHLLNKRLGYGCRCCGAGHGHVCRYHHLLACNSTVICHLTL